MACTDNNSTINSDIEKYISVNQGVYGQTTSFNDVGSNNSIKYLPGFIVKVFKDTQPLADSTPIAQTQSDSVGFYEIPLDTGEYLLCTSFDRCVKVFIDTVKLLRCDYSFSIAPGWSCGGLNLSQNQMRLSSVRKISLNSPY